MIPQPSIPEPLWSSVPSDAQAAAPALLESLAKRIVELESQLYQNFTNSSKPPSSDPIGPKREPPTPPTGRKRGGQLGRPKAQRPLVSPEQVRSTRDCRPSSCRRYAQPLGGVDPQPVIHQVADLPKIEPVVDEYRFHRLPYPHCGETTCRTLPEGGPTGSFGPCLQAVLATLAGAYRLSKRRIQQLRGVPGSSGDTRGVPGTPYATPVGLESSGDRLESSGDSIRNSGEFRGSSGDSILNSGGTGLCSTRGNRRTTSSGASPS